MSQPRNGAENLSPALQRWVGDKNNPSAVGTAERISDNRVADAFSRAFQGQERCERALAPEAIFSFTSAAKAGYLQASLGTAEAVLHPSQPDLFMPGPRSGFPAA